mmetsp:Transcript_14406/g.38582  ORF Transcript_14406/g.38582 Transcript_14406/m.38582 type:complete len:98 (+) Transcript_14406:1068-1361(+)
MLRMAVLFIAFTSADSLQAPDVGSTQSGIIVKVSAYLIIELTKLLQLNAAAQSVAHARTCAMLSRLWRLANNSSSSRFALQRKELCKREQTCDVTVK